MKKVIGFLRIIRPVNCVMMGFAVIVGAVISTRGGISGGDMINLALGFITAFTLTGASMAINDYYDREIDAINEPSRPIPSGLISPMESIAIFIALTIIGLSSAMLVNNLCLLLAIASIIISTLYSTSGKRTGLPGNIMVSTCISMPFIYGGTCMRGIVEPGTLIFAAMAFLVNTGREIIKGIADIEGDKMGGVKTLAVSHGPKRAAKVALALIITAVAISPLPIILNLTNIWFIPLLLIADAGFIISAISVAKNITRENSKKVKKAILIYMLISLIAFLAGTIK